VACESDAEDAEDAKDAAAAAWPLWRRHAASCAEPVAAGARRAWARAGARCGAHLPPALACLLAIALLCHALSAATRGGGSGGSGGGATHSLLTPRSGLTWWLHPHAPSAAAAAPLAPCAYTLTIRRELLPGGAAARVTVNGASPGPVLRCALGRALAVTVVNELPRREGGTAVHWHGVRQHGTPWADGVPGLTQARARARAQRRQQQQQQQRQRRPHGTRQYYSLARAPLAVPF
jgi:FtsP/CotA-like multicopper oxidase with cupredoxin domain